MNNEAHERIFYLRGTVGVRFRVQYAAAPFSSGTGLDLQRCLHPYLLSGRTAEVPSENEFIEKFGLVPGPHYTDEFLAKGMLSPARTVKTHKNFRPEEIGLPLLAKLLAEKYYIMAECMYNYAHWVVVLGYFAVRDPEDTEEHRILLYDPYYDQVRLVIADEFLTMWCDPDGHVKEFVAIR